MAVTRDYSVLELDGPRLVAISASVSGSRIEVKRWLTSVRPEVVRADDAVAVGQWIGSEFDRAELPKGRVVLAVPRGDVILKQLSIPAGEAGVVSEADLAGIVQLAMTRQLTMQIGGSSIDYLPIDEGVGQSGEAGAARWVLAGAMPADRVEWCRGVTAAAGMKLRRVGLRCFGAAALLAGLSQRRAGPVLGIAVGAGSAEFVIVEDGVMTFARAVDVARPGARSEIEAFADRLGVEAKRTWMSYRSSRAGPDVELVAVIGEGELSRAVGERCGAAVNAAWELAAVPPFVELPANMPESERAMASPLVGLLAETVLERPTLDFANPRRLPDVSGRRRQLALAGVLGAILLGGAGYVVADQRLGRLRTELEEARTAEAGARKDLEGYLVSHARLNHFEQWAGAKVDWLAHIKRVNDELPEAVVGQLDQLGGRVVVTPSFAPKSGLGYPAGAWSTRWALTLDMTGRVDSRQIASDLRERLLNTGVYGVESQGPDVPDRYSLQLTTDKPTPVVEAAPKAGETKKSGGGKAGRE